MKLYDYNTDSVVTLQQLKADYISFKDECEEKTFPEYLANVIDATLRGRNDCELMNMTEKSAWRLMEKIVRRWRV